MKSFLFYEICFVITTILERNWWTAVRIRTAKCRKLDRQHILLEYVVILIKNCINYNEKKNSYFVFFIVIINIFYNIVSADGWNGITKL